MKKRSERRKHRAGCSKAEPKTFAPPQTPFPGARDGQHLISWRWSLPLPTFGEDRCTQFRVIVVTDPQTNTHTNPKTHPPRGPITIHCAEASAQCNYHNNNNIGIRRVPKSWGALETAKFLRDMGPLPRRNAPVGTSTYKCRMKFVSRW